ncbi:hypothetical protein ACHAW5_001815 [Stephanodiscus triporus]|uniref:Uncharacterized protein n=1 Tax=Stephanodiscus triporus TaxID=2934178 RepID=A0ABD3NJC3_9STRA
MATSSPRWRALGRCASIALSLMLLLLTNNVYAIDGSAHSRFRADVGNVDNGKHHEQPLKRRRAAKAEHVKAHHGGGRGHHRDKTPATSLAALAPEAVLVSESVASSHGSGKSGKEVVTPAETLQEVAVVSESVAVSSGGKSGKEVPPTSTVPQSVTSSPGSGKSGKEVIAPTETLTPVAHTDAVSTTALENATVTEGVLTMAAVAPADAEHSIATPIIDVSAGGGGNAMPYDSKVGKIYKEEPDADLVKPKASKANHPLTEYFIKESTVPALTKSGKSGKSAGGSSVGDKSSKDATSGKSSKAAALASMSFDFASTGRTIYDLLAANPNFTTLVAAVDAAGLTDVLKVAGPLTVAGMYEKRGKHIA